MGQSVLDVITHWRAPFSRRYQVPEVIEECGTPNVLCIQELLSRDSQRFFDGLVRKYFPFAVRDNDRFGFLSMRGSGLGVGTRLKQNSAHFLAFRTKGASWDRYARKGALYTQLDYDGKTIDLMTVHLQAGYNAKCQAVRASQLRELRTWVDRFGSAERPFIICGDFNIQGLAATRAQGEYKTLADTLADFDDLGAESDLATYHPHPEGNPLAHLFEKQSSAQRIDYIMVRPATKAAKLSYSGIKLFFDKPLKGLGRGIGSWASDHYGLTATFEI
jgi:endonuclease/exonuclease/phosphatase family metal-dependent hydrolase